MLTLLSNTKTQIKEYYIDKGYYNVAVEILSEEDKNSKNQDVILTIKINKGKKVRIQEKFPKLIHLVPLFLPYIQSTVYTFYKMILLQNEKSEISRDDL